MLKRFRCALLVALLIICGSNLYSQESRLLIPVKASPKQYAISMQKDTVVASDILKKLSRLSDKLSVKELMIVAAKELMGTPYVAGTLDQTIQENLNIYLTQTDCILFVETCMNLALCAKQHGESANYSKFANLVLESRYREGNALNYSDRIHYTTEWVRKGERRGIVKDITKQIGGVVYNHPIYFMSKNYNSYKQLALADDIIKRENSAKSAGTKFYLNVADYSPEKVHAYASYKTIQKVEKELNKKAIYYIPQGSIKALEKNIESGDIICYMSGVKGLDIAHVAIAYVNGGKVGFIHASMAKMKVVEDAKSIADYVSSSKNITGIMVVRPQ